MSPVRSVGVVGAGVVGLATAWHLRRHGAEVAVFDRAAPGSGASHGNAGWLTPGLVEPLPSPGTLRHGLVDVLRPGSPIAVGSLAPGMLAFLARLARNSSRSRFRRAVEALRVLTDDALSAYDELAAAGIGATAEGPILAVFSSEAERRRYLDAHSEPRGHGPAIEPVSGSQARSLVPALTMRAVAGALIRGQRHLDPGVLTARLSQGLAQDGARVRAGAAVRSVRARSGGIRLALTDGTSTEPFDAVVVANGVEAGRLVSPHGVRIPMVAGRGYSVSAFPEPMPSVPVYVPEQRVACTPLAGRLRVVGVMEFTSHGAPMNPRRIDSLVAAAGSFLSGVDPARVRDPWVGSRPCTADGLPLIGPTRTPGVYVASGHAMWGVTLGPVTGRLLARAVLGEPVPELTPFSPTR